MVRGILKIVMCEMFDAFAGHIEACSCFLISVHFQSSSSNTILHVIGAFAMCFELVAFFVVVIDVSRGQILQTGGLQFLH